MRTDIKQAMHMDAAKSFSTTEANENERCWNEERFDQKNQDPTNHYDKTRQHLNFEITRREDSSTRLSRDIFGGASGREIEATGLAQFQGRKQEPAEHVCQVHLRWEP